MFNKGDVVVCIRDVITHTGKVLVKTNSLHICYEDSFVVQGDIYISIVEKYPIKFMHLPSEYFKKLEVGDLLIKENGGTYRVTHLKLYGGLIRVTEVGSTCGAGYDNSSLCRCFTHCGVSVSFIPYNPTWNNSVDFSKAEDKIYKLLETGSFYKSSSNFGVGTKITIIASNKKEKQMNKIIAEMYPKTRDAMLVDKWFGHMNVFDCLEDKAEVALVKLMFKGKEEDLLKAAQELEAESNKKA